MKKRILTLTLGSLLVAFACSKTDTSVSTAADCSTAAVTEYNAALTAYSADPTNKTKCQAVVTAAGKFVNCSGVTAADKKAYQDLINSNPCK